MDSYYPGDDPNHTISGSLLCIYSHSNSMHRSLSFAFSLLMAIPLGSLGAGDETTNVSACIQGKNGSTIR